jgi:hypothetical protein
MKKLPFLLIIFLIFLSCEQNDEHIILASEHASDNIFKDEITANDAKNVAQIFINNTSQIDYKPFNKKNLTKNHTKIQDQKKIKNLFEIKDNDSLVLMFVINFEEGGFCIISASKKVEPILAYSETGYFDKNNIPNFGITMWVEETSSSIKNSDKLSASQIASNRLKWKIFEEGSGKTFENSSAKNYSSTSYNSSYDQQRVQAFNQRMGELGGGGLNTVIPLSEASSYLPPNRLQHFKSIAAQHGSPEQFTIIEIIDKTFSRSIGPLINTNWHQGTPFNELVPNDYAGCTAIAAGQIMYYNEHPTTYNWNHMTSSNLYLYDDIKYLMKDLGDSFDMNYKSDGSGAYINDVKSGLENDYGYQVTKSDHSVVDVSNWLFNNQQPVYLTGSRTTVIPGLIYKNGHAWVCEGVKEYRPDKAFRIQWQVGSNGNYSYDTDGITYFESAQTTTAHGYMNWGWGSHYNGWYGLGATQPISSSYNYKYQRKNLYIKPN